MAAIVSDGERARKLKKLGLTIARKTRTQVLGSSNVRGDDVMSAGWLPLLAGEGRARSGPKHWRGASLGDPKSRKLPTLMGEVGSRFWSKELRHQEKTWWLGPGIAGENDKLYKTRVENVGVDAARHHYYRGGNCYGMASVALHFLCDVLISDPSYRESFEKGEIQISVQKLGSYDHAMIRLDWVDKDEISNDIVTVYIDPWLGSDACYSLEEFDTYKRKIFTKLHHELTQMGIHRDTDEKRVAELMGRYRVEADQTYTEEGVNKLKAENFLNIVHIGSLYSAMLLRRRFSEKFYT